MNMPKILVAPLDWGLGHATRCIPIIRELIQRQCRVELGGSGAAAKILQQEFPDLPFHTLPSYNIQYPENGGAFISKIILQIPGILNTIRIEHQWLKEKQHEHHWDLIISDNRYGLWHPKIRTIFITHQLQIISGWGHFIDLLIRQLHYKLIHRFTHCWVPDQEQQPCLAGILSHPSQLPNNARYIGPLSRFNDLEKGNESKIVIALSGPEPQRSILEEKLIILFNKPQWSNQQIEFIRGLPNAHTTPTAAYNINFVNHLNSNEFVKMISSASMLICRSGYSSIMDLVRLGKKALLIPTPGQTEQEYLAKWMSEQNLFISCSQDDPNLEHLIGQTLEQPELKINPDFEEYKKALDELGIQ